MSNKNRNSDAFANSRDNENTVTRSPRSSSATLSSPEDRMNRQRKRARAALGSGNKKDVQKLKGIRLNPEMVYRGVNDDPYYDRYQEAIAQGWEPLIAEDAQLEDDGADVEIPKSAVVSRVGGCDRMGNPMRMYIMYMPRDLHEEIVAAHSHRLSVK